MTVYDELFGIRSGSFHINTKPYRVHASFRIFHDDLDPVELTELFCVEPTRTHRKGDQRVGKNGRLYSPFKQGSWILDSEKHVNSADVNEHIHWLLNELSSCTGAIHKLQSSGFLVDVVCGWFASSDNTCPTLQPDTIRRLSRFRIGCWFDVYLFPPDDDETKEPYKH